MAPGSVFCLFYLSLSQLHFSILICFSSDINIAAEMAQAHSQPAARVVYIYVRLTGLCRLLITTELLFHTHILMSWCKKSKCSVLDTLISSEWTMSCFCIETFEKTKHVLQTFSPSLHKLNVFSQFLDIFLV